MKKLKVSDEIAKSNIQINSSWNFLNEIDEITCKRIINLSKGKWEKGTVGGLVKPSNGIRQSDIVWTMEQWVYDLVFKYMQIANKNSGWNFNIDAAEEMQITKYDVGGYYEYHYDGNGITKYNDPKNKFLHGKTRKLSMTIVLNDDYEGGEFTFLNSLSQDLIKEKAGTIITFPSYMVHKVNPITKGTRYSLVVWFVGEPFK